MIRAQEREILTVTQRALANVQLALSFAREAQAENNTSASRLAVSFLEDAELDLKILCQRER